MAVFVLVISAVDHARWGVAQSESLFMYALALWHGIYAIWYAKGRALIPFAKATVVGRLAAAAAQLGVLALAQVTEDAFARIWMLYLGVQCAADALSAGLAWLTLRGTTSPQRPSGRPHSEARNRLLFASYMTLLAAWMTLSTQTFLGFFQLPATQYAPPRFGPIHVLAAQIWVLASYNAVAARHQLQPLIEAGIRGGLATCVFFIALVGAGLLHPLVLVLPAVDLVSVLWLHLSRTRSGTPVGP